METKEAQASFEERHAMVVRTELLLQTVENLYEGFSLAPCEWTMWLPGTQLAQLAEQAQGQSLSLRPVEEERDWAALRRAREEVEVAFGIDQKELVRKFVEDARAKVTRFGGCWYLAEADGEVVGEIGLVPFVFQGKRIGRLQDVDILPRAQGRGLGNQLMRAICREAQQQGLEALCLMAKADDWPRLWYQRLGFLKTGEKHAQPWLLSSVRERLFATLREELGCHTIILYGSLVRGQANARSDIDAFGIWSRTEQHHVSQTVQDSQLDAWIYPEAALPPAESLTHLRDGIVLCEQERRGSRLLQEIQEHLKQWTPTAPAAWEVSRDIAWMRKMLIRIDNDSPHAHYCRHWLLTTCLEMAFAFLLLPYPGPKQAFSTLQTQDPSLYDAFQKALQPGAAHEDIEALVEELIAKAP